MDEISATALDNTPKGYLVSCSYFDGQYTSKFMCKLFLRYDRALVYQQVCCKMVHALCKLDLQITPLKFVDNDKSKGSSAECIVVESRASGACARTELIPISDAQLFDYCGQSTTYGVIEYSSDVLHNHSLQLGPDYNDENQQVRQFRKKFRFTRFAPEFGLYDCSSHLILKSHLEQCKVDGRLVKCFTVPTDPIVGNPQPICRKITAEFSVVFNLLQTAGLAAKDAECYQYWVAPTLLRRLKQAEQYMYAQMFASSNTATTPQNGAPMINRRTQYTNWLTNKTADIRYQLTTTKTTTRYTCTICSETFEVVDGLDNGPGDQLIDYGDDEIVLQLHHYICMSGLSAPLKCSKYLMDYPATSIDPDLMYTLHTVIASVSSNATTSTSFTTNSI